MSGGDPAPAAPDERLLVPRPEHVGRRLDQVLADLLPEHSRAAIQRWIKEGRVRARPGPAPGAAATPDTTPDKPRWPLPAGAVLLVRIPEDRPFELAAEPLAVRVLYSDDALVVVDKPPGMVVHPSPGHSGGTLVNALLHEGGGLSSAGGDERPGIVHRLDRDTSGVMVVARTDAAHRALAAQFKARAVEKVYVAIARGRARDDRFRVDLAIGRSSHHRKKMAARPDGRAADTEFDVVERFAAGAGFVHLRCRPRTGRTHQIRVHLHARSLPLLCDALYAPQREVTAAELQGRRPAPGEPPVLARHALHAARLAFRHPTSDAPLAFEAPLPADLAAALAALRARA